MTEEARWTNNEVSLKVWARYWCVFAILNQFDFCMFERVIPFYIVIKAAILLYIVMPNTNGARIIYGFVVESFFV
uniref:Protein YOP1 n=1 Tax=Globodera pallida TaxID=36090 RepID=A0A183BU45_GLOPA